MHVMLCLFYPLQGQYVLIHDVILQWVLYGDTETSVTDFLHPFRQHSSCRDLQSKEHMEDGRDRGTNSEEEGGERRSTGGELEKGEDRKKQNKDSGIKSNMCVGLKKMIKVG